MESTYTVIGALSCRLATTPSSPSPSVTLKPLALVDDWRGGTNVCHLLPNEVTLLGTFASPLGDETPTALLYLWQPNAGKVFNLLPTPWIHPDAPV